MALWRFGLDFHGLCGEKDFHSFPKVIHVESVYRFLVTGIDVGGNILDGFGESGVFADPLLYLVDGVDDGAVIPVAEFPADVGQGHVADFPDEIHGHLPASNGISVPLLASNGFLVDAVIFADLPDDDVGGGDIFFFLPEHVPDGPVDRGSGYRGR